MSTLITLMGGICCPIDDTRSKEVLLTKVKSIITARGVNVNYASEQQVKQRSDSLNGYLVINIAFEQSQQIRSLTELSTAQHK